MTRMTNDANTIIAVQVNRDLALVIAVAIPMPAISIYFILRRGIPLFIRMQQKMDRVNSAVQENLMNIRVVKSFVR